MRHAHQQRFRYALHQPHANAIFYQFSCCSYLRTHPRPMSRCSARAYLRKEVGALDRNRMPTTKLFSVNLDWDRTGIRLRQGTSRTQWMCATSGIVRWMDLGQEAWLLGAGYWRCWLAGWLTVGWAVMLCCALRRDAAAYRYGWMDCESPSW